MARIAVIGPGAIGGTMAAHLAAAGHDVTLAARTPVPGLEVETPEGVLVASCRVLLDPSAPNGPGLDWVLVATKAYDATETARWLGALCRPATSVAVLQNGVEHLERFPSAKNAVPVVVECSAERTAPGRIRQRNQARLVVPKGDGGDRFAALFAETRVNVEPTADFATAMWRKLCLNSAGAVPALLMKPNAVARHEGAANIIRAIVAECVAVGRAEGAILDDRIVEDVLDRMRGSTGKNSLTVDRIEGRPMEIDARNGVIVRLGARHGIGTPMNAFVVALLDAAQRV